MKYNRLIIILSFSATIYSCASRDGQTAVTENILSSEESAAFESQGKIIRRLTDEILQALARHEYARLAEFIVPGEPAVKGGPQPQPRAGDFQRRQAISGWEVALRLLGQDAFLIVLDRWDAQNIEVSFTDKLCRAQARVKVTVRRRPNRRPKTIYFLFHFHRSSKSGPWRLDIH